MEKHVFTDTNMLDIMRVMNNLSLRVVRAIPKRQPKGSPELVVVYAVKSE